MNFYSTWADVRALGIDDSAFMHSFLRSSDVSRSILLQGSTQELECALCLLREIPAIEFVNGIGKIDDDHQLTPAEVPCFSTFSNGAVRLNELLEFTDSGLTYAQIGYQLTNTPNLLAQIKYGENHAKLAAMMDLVDIQVKHRPAIVKTTTLGRYLVAFALEEKATILRKLLLRDNCIQAITQQAVTGTADYRSVVRGLSDATAYRRRTSVRCVVEFALGSPDTAEALEHITWDL